LPGDPNAVMVSINDPGFEPARLADGFAAVLRVAFWDVPGEQPIVGELNGQRLCFAPITEEQAGDIVEFIARWHELPDGPEILLVHCRAGISRSAALARYAAQRYRLELAQTAEFANPEVLRKLRRAADTEPPGEER
jgi:predicted protein tyrosine phosphatase